MIENNFYQFNGKTLVAIEHAMFTFDDLKVNSRDDRQTDRQGMPKNMAATRKFDFNRAYCSKISVSCTSNTLRLL